jgi:hypothetical protein
MADVNRLHPRREDTHLFDGVRWYQTVQVIVRMVLRSLALALAWAPMEWWSLAHNDWHYLRHQDGISPEKMLQLLLLTSIVQLALIALIVAILIWGSSLILVLLACAAAGSYIILSCIRWI